MSPDTAAENNPDRPVPHAVSPALRRRLQQCYEHGTRLFQQENYDHDYAHSILVECVLNDPGNTGYVEAVLQNLQRKYKNNKRGALLRCFAGRAGFKRALAKKDWGEVFRLGIALLQTNPWDVSALRGLAAACAACGCHEAELRYLKNALEANPRDPEINQHCARSLARVGQFDQAIACWQRVDETRKGDEEAQKMISELQIEKTRQRTGMGGDESRVPIAKRPNPPSLPQREKPVTQTPRRREVQLTPRQQLDQQIVNNPADLDAYLQLAQLHVDEDRLGDAAHVLHKALQASGSDPTVQERLEDVEILRKKRQLAVMEKRAALEQTAEAQQLAQQLRSELDRFEWEVFLARSQRCPKDLETKYQLGLRLKRLDKLREAVQCLEASGQLPDRRAASYLELGECWQRLKQYGKAVDLYRHAAEACSSEQADLMKLALYRGGVLAAGLHNVESARTLLSQLVKIDPRFKDAATRLDKLGQIDDKV